jgi:hypothetical protein
MDGLNSMPSGRGVVLVRKEVERAVRQIVCVVRASNVTRDAPVYKELSVSQSLFAADLG